MQTSVAVSSPLPHIAAQVLLVAELEELQANPTRAARGTVLEASLDKKAGAVCSLLVQAGTLRVGDAVQAGSAYGKVSGGR
jgi:translation initiation factor IF-2